MTAQRLERAALSYLERYATNRVHLARLLTRRIALSVRRHGPEATSAGPEEVEALLDRLQRAGLLDDEAYAEGQARSLQRRGLSLAGIRSRLGQRGLSGEAIEQGVQQLIEEVPAPDLAAAVAFARRRRLGPYRPRDQRDANRQRDLAALARRAFPLGLARTVVDAEDPDALERLLEEAADDRGGTAPGAYG